MFASRPPRPPMDGQACLQKVVASLQNLKNGLSSSRQVLSYQRVSSSRRVLSSRPTKPHPEGVPSFQVASSRKRVGFPQKQYGSVGEDRSAPLLKSFLREGPEFHHVAEALARSDSDAPPPSHFYDFTEMYRGLQAWAAKHRGPVSLEEIQHIERVHAKSVEQSALYIKKMKRGKLHPVTSARQSAGFLGRISKQLFTVSQYLFTDEVPEGQRRRYVLARVAQHEAIMVHVGKSIAAIQASLMEGGRSRGAAKEHGRAYVNRSSEDKSLLARLLRHGSGTSDVVKEYLSEDDKFRLMLFGLLADVDKREAEMILQAATKVSHLGALAQLGHG